MRCLPAVTVTLFASLSFQTSYFFAPSTHSTIRTTPAGELPAAFTVKVVPVPPFVGAQIFALWVSDPGGVQFVGPLFAIMVNKDDDGTTISVRESEFIFRRIATATGPSVTPAVRSGPKAPLPV